MLALIGAIVALVLGLVAVVQDNGRNWAGWGVIVIAAVLLLGAR